jgi:hypothetical protein
LLQQPAASVFKNFVAATVLAGGIFEKLPKLMLVQQHKLAKYSKLPV